MMLSWGIYEQNSTVNSVCVDDWTAELAIIASNVNADRNQSGHPS